MACADKHQINNWQWLDRGQNYPNNLYLWSNCWLCFVLPPATSHATQYDRAQCKKVARREIGWMCRLVPTNTHNTFTRSQGWHSGTPRRIEQDKTGDENNKDLIKKRKEKRPKLKLEHVGIIDKHQPPLASSGILSDPPFPSRLPPHLSLHLKWRVWCKVATVPMSSSWSPPPSKMLRQVCVPGRGLSAPSLYITRQLSSSGSNHHLTSVLPPPAASLQTSDERGGGDHPRAPPRLPRPRQPHAQPQPQLHRLRLGGGGQGGHPAHRLQPDHRAVPGGQAAPQRARLLHHPPLLLPRPRRCRFGDHWTELWYPNPQIVHVLKIVRQKMKNSCRPNNILVKVQDHGSKIISYFLHSGATLLATHKVSHLPLTILWFIQHVDV